MKKYEAYVFDLYGTLVDIKTDEEDKRLWKETALFYGYNKASYSAEELKTRYHFLVEEALKEKKATESERYAHEAYPDIPIEDVFKALYREKGVKPSEELIKRTCQVFRIASTKRLKLYKGAKELLSDLKRSGKKVYLLSNAQRQFTEYELVSLGIWDMFDGILISSEEGVRKPDGAFFDKLEERFGIDFGKSIMIGNDSTTDMQGAKEKGMDTFYIHSNISPAGDYAKGVTYQLDRMNLTRVSTMLLGE